MSTLGDLREKKRKKEIDQIKAAMASGVKSTPNLLRNIVSLIRQRVAANVEGKQCNSIVSEVSSLVSKVTAETLKFDAKQVLLAVDAHNKTNHYKPAPVIYIPVHECPVVSMGIFFLRSSNSVIPMHDHPEITGCIKVIHGTAVVKQVDAKQDSEMTRREPSLFRVARSETTVLSSNQEEVVTIEPKNFNFHEISVAPPSSDSPQLLENMAFFDVLFPPYEPPIRDCHYFVHPVLVNNEEYMKKLDGAPSHDVFSTDLGPYFGPLLEFDD